MSVHRNVNDAFINLVSLFTHYSGSSRIRKRDSRNGPVLYYDEPVIITYTHPRERVLFNAARDANPFFHIYESLWMLAGRNDVAPLAYYASNMNSFSDDGKVLNGAYGYRWRQHYLEDDNAGKPSVDQLTVLINHLKSQPDSRRAVLQMWDVENDLLKIGGHRVCSNCNGIKRGPEMSGSFKAVDSSYACPRCKGTGLEPGSLDTCCNLSVCFSIRRDWELGDNPPQTARAPRYLDMTVFNRSNDLIWGTLGANVVHFSFLLEYMAYCLGVEVGKYHQVSNNQHVYLANFKPEKWVPSNQRELERVYGPATYPKLGPKLVQDKEVFDTEVKEIVDCYAGTGQHKLFNWQEPFLRHVAMPMMLAFYYHKHRDYDSALNIIEEVQADDWRIAGYEWLMRRRDKWLAKQKETK